MMGTPIIFKIPLSNIVGRLDPLFYEIPIMELFKNCPYPLKHLLSNISYIKTGFAAGKNDQAEQNENGILQIRPTNINEDRELVFDKNIYLPRNLIIKYSGDKLNKKEVLFNNTNSQYLVGKTTYFDIDGDFFCSNHITRIKANEVTLNGEYLSHLLNLYQLHKVFYRSCINWNNQSGFNSDAISKLLIPIPPINEQKKIAILMQSAYTEKKQKEAEAEKLLASIDTVLYRSLKISPIQKEKLILTNRVYTAKLSLLTGNVYDPKTFLPSSQELFQSLCDPKFPKKMLRHLIVHQSAGDWGEDEDYIDAKNRYVKCLVIRSTEFDNQKNLFISNGREKYRNILKSKIIQMNIEADDILIEKSGGSPNQPVGRVAIIEEELINNHKLAYSNFIEKIKVDKKQINSKYLFYYLRFIHSIGITDILQSQTNGIRNLMIQKYLNISIIIPSEKVQNSIINEIKAIEQKAETLRQSAQQTLNSAKAQVEKIILGD